MPHPGFTIFINSPHDLGGVELVVATTRSGGVGIVDAALAHDSASILPCLEKLEHSQTGAKGAYGLKLGSVTEEILSAISPYFSKNLRWLIVDARSADTYFTLAKNFKVLPGRVLVECISKEIPDCVARQLPDGVIVKGNESGGYVGEDASFILLQHWVKQTELPIYVRGGMTPHVAAACEAMGIAGGMLDSQVLLLEESPVASVLQKLVAPLSGSETVAVGDGEKAEYFRCLNHPQFKAAKEFITAGEVKPIEEIRELVKKTGVNWADPKQALLPVGHDICFADSWRKAYGTVPKLMKAFRTALETYAPKAAAQPPLVEGSKLAQVLGTKFPIIQGPMTRVSDNAGFANAIADAGALPMLAFAVMRPKQITEMLTETKKLLGNKPWGIGLLGFVPPMQLDEQIAAALPFKPNYAIIAGGRPDQAVALEKQGIPSYLHLPSANLLSHFLQGGARRFIFEGRECGGHIGPLSSFTLWSTMIDRLLTELDASGVAGADVQCIFAGGIHDAYSSAFLQVMVAPLIEKGVNIGIIMGSAYLFTKEIVESGAIVEQFQKTVLECEHTVNLESGPGHASRCAYTPFAEDFFKTRRDLKTTGLPADEMRNKLDDLILGTLRVASKGTVRKGDDIVKVSLKEQKQTGMYMLGQVVPLKDAVLTVAELHTHVTADAKKLLEAKLAETVKPKSAIIPTQKPADIAIVGMNCLVPGAKNGREYWENILAKMDAITEVPKHRWDWRLYFDANRDAKDKIYSRWGGFIDDMPFDPMRYGITPKSIESVDPMQLMALEVAYQAVVDAGFTENDATLRSRTSVIIGASGGTGDIGQQYGMRAELPRFHGQLPEAVAKQLPEWTEDTFAGILINVVSGRIANRLNLGGTNYTTDAACASSLSAVYQAVAELQSGRSDAVIAGGVDTVQGPFGYMCFSKTQALSPRGKCRSFDATGDGIVISEGIVMMVLKRLDDAERDGDRVYAVIKGIGAGSDGKAKGLSAPEPAGQLRAMRRAYAQAGFAPNTVRLFEAHGTGTVAGDTAELESTGLLVRESSGLPRSAVVGSVKTMIGHTKATAGIAGMMKAALSLYHKILPPHANVDRPNKVLADKTAPLYLQDKAEPWLVSQNFPRRAACSAFGFGGTNFHVVMEEYQGEYRSWKQPSVRDNWEAELFLFRGADIAKQLANVQAILAGKPDILLRDLAKAVAKAQPVTGETLAIVASNFEQLAERISAFLSATKSEGVYHSVTNGGKLAVLFSGQGSQYTGMLQDISVQFPTYATVLSRANRYLTEPFTTRFGKGRPLTSFMFPRGAYDADSKTAAEEALKSTDVTQPALGAVEVGLWKLMQEFGLKADMLAGHSYGEFAALYAADWLSLKDLMAISEARGRLIVDKAKEAGAELGTMAAVKATRAEVEQAIKSLKGVVIANHNAPTQVIISGSAAGIEKAVAALTEANLSVTRIPVAAAFHSPFVEPAQTALSMVINGVSWKNGDGTAVYSNNTAAPHSNNVKDIQSAMAAHLTGSVEFVAEIEAMYKDGARVFLELGPKNVLTKLTGQILKGKPHTAIAFDDNGKGITGMLHAFAQLLACGVELNVLKLFEGRDCLENDMRTIAQARRNPALPKHAWLINGSSVRRAGTPRKQVGLTLEEVQALEAQPKSAAAPAPVAAQPKLPPVMTPTLKPTIPAQPKGERKPMTQRNFNLPPQTAASGNSVAQAYFDLVNRQLDNAREIALAELGLAPAAAQPVARPQMIAAAPVLPQPRMAAPAMPRAAAPVAPRAAAPVAAPAVAKAAPVVAVAVASPAASATLDKAAIKEIMLKVVSEKTGYEADMIAFNQNLEADLGVDSIKRVDIVGGILNGLPASYKTALGDTGRTKLSTSKTLDCMLSLLLEAAGTPANSNTVTNTAAAAPAASAVDEGAVRAIMLTVVSEKTGYEADMVDFNQNLEADLGVDSIKRVDIVGGILNALPPSYKEALGDTGRTQMSTAKTLGDMLKLLQSAQPAEGKVAVNFNLAGAGSKSANEVRILPRLVESRFVMQAVAEAIPASAARGLTAGDIILTTDKNGVADKLGTLLKAKGCTVHMVPAKALKDEAALLAWCESVALESVAGIVHLAALDAEALSDKSDSNDWKQQLFVNEKALFTLIKAFSLKLKQDAHIIAASGLGGTFGRNNAAGELTLQGGSVGAIKSLRKERENLRGKAVDIDPAQKADAQAAQIFAEMEVQGGRWEVGYPKGQRTIFKSVLTNTETPAPVVTDSGLVMLATGGARGVTAEVLRDVAKPGNTLILTGRSALPTKDKALPEHPELTSEKDLAKHFAKAESLPLGDARRKANAVLAAREMLDNVADFEAGGAKVEYIAVDVTDEAAMKKTMADIYKRHKKIDGIVHGAGIIEDKFFADITSESWDRVLHTKVFGMLLLQKYAKAESLRWFTVFSSVAGRYGNSGQSNYATANELMNRLCCQLAAKWSHVGVSALNWGPWGKTKFGAGMVTEATEAKFARQGVYLVHAEQGRDLFRQQITGFKENAVEIICGKAPWEDYETTLGAYTYSAAVKGLLGDAAIEIMPKGDLVMKVTLPRQERYLQDHIIDTDPVLPMAVAMEMMAEAVEKGFGKGWKIAEVTQAQLFKGVIVDKDNYPLTISMVATSHGMDTTNSVKVKIMSAGDKPMPHYGATIVLVPQLPANTEAAPATAWQGSRHLSTQEAYSRLFHGPSFRVITGIEQFSEQGARCTVRATKQADLLNNPKGSWLFDPALIDAAAHMSVLWMDLFRDAFALPMNFGRITRFAETLPETLVMDYLVRDVTPEMVLVDVYFSDTHGNVLLEIEGMKHVVSATHKTGAKKTA